MSNELKHDAKGKTLTLERLFDAPRELVFSCWTDEEQIKNWWIPGPGWTVPHSKMNLEVGGNWHYMMKGPDDGSEWANMESWGITTYIEIDPPKKLVYEDSFSDENGGVNKDFPTSTTTLELIEQGEKTLMRATTLYASEEDLQKVINMGMIQGVENTYGYLDTLLEKLQQS